MTVNGEFHISQRFAIDWLKVDDKNRFFLNKGEKNSDYFCYGVTALAVADGTVVDLSDGLADCDPLNPTPPYAISPRTIGGNWVALEIAPHRYCMYAHLQPGSLLVKKGDRVKRGQPLGKIGNSGNSSAPHLHMHVSDRPDWIEAEGLPYSFDHFTSLGQIVVDDDGQKTRLVPTPPTLQSHKIPGLWGLVEFGP